MKILVVDDSRVMRSLVVRVLKAAGYTDLAEAGSGKEALAAVRAGGFDFVLTDWNMPEMDGLTFLKILQSEGPKLPVGFVTSECTGQMIALAQAEGARFVVNKPFTAETLSQALTGAMGAQAA
jgi:two-component system, chemotaxis family, chemotaxis protein CheY